MENVLLCQSLILQDLIDAVIPYEKIKPVEPLPTPPTDPEVSQLIFFLNSTLLHSFVILPVTETIFGIRGLFLGQDM